MRPLDVFGTGKATIAERAFGGTAIPIAPSLQRRSHQAAIGAGIANPDIDHNRFAGCARDLDIVSRAESAIGHLHDPRVCVGGRGARLLRLLAVAALLGALLTLFFDLAMRRLRRLEPVAALARGTLLSGFHALVAGIRVRIDLLLELLEDGLGDGKLLIKRRLAAERGRPGICPD